MIRFSFSSFYMSLIFANIMILFLYIAFHSQRLMIKLGLPILSSAVFVTILRMVLPFEFLSFSHNIYFPEIISRIISYFLSPRFFQKRFSLWTFVQIIWLIGIILHTIKYFLTEYNCYKEIKYSSKKIPEFSHVNQIFKEIQKELPKTYCIEIRTFPFIQTPAIYGLKKPYILLPEDLNLTDKQLYYILRHEVSHYLHHDILLKFGVKIICIIYWWNPFCKFLEVKLNEILEMRVDQTMAKHQKQKIEYLECLLFIADHMTQPNVKINKSSTISFYSNFSPTLKQRFKMLLNDGVQPFYKLKRHVLLLSFTILFLFSFIFIFEASYITPEDNINRDIPSTNNSYFIEREDGFYDFYINGEYILSEDSLEYYSDDIPIYREEVNPHETN